MSIMPMLPSTGMTVSGDVSGSDGFVEGEISEFSDALAGFLSEEGSDEGSVGVDAAANLMELIPDDEAAAVALESLQSLDSLDSVALSRLMASLGGFNLTEEDAAALNGVVEDGEVADEGEMAGDAVDVASMVAVDTAVVAPVVASTTATAGSAVSGDPVAGGPVSAPAGVAVGGGSAGMTGEPGTGGSNTGGTSTGAPVVVVPSDAAPVEGMVPTASVQVPAAKAVAVTGLVAAPPVDAPRPTVVAHQVASQMAFLSSAANGNHVMTVQITPDDLGPVQIVVSLTDGDLDMTIRTALEAGRDTLTQAAPELRRYLESTGLTCSRIEVDLDANQSSWQRQPDADSGHKDSDSAERRTQAGKPTSDNDGDGTEAVPVDSRTPNSTPYSVDLHM